MCYSCPWDEFSALDYFVSSHRWLQLRCRGLRRVDLLKNFRILSFRFSDSVALFAILSEGSYFLVFQGFHEC